MTVAAEPAPPEAAPPVPPQAAPPGRPLTAAVAEWGWSRIRWLAAELTIVVAGILIALAIQSRVDARDDRAREREYLLQLQADLRQTERLVLRDDSIHRVRDREGVKLLHAFFTPERPPRDSVLVWAINATWYEPRRPIMGTAEALVATGDLSLLEDHALRAAVTEYLAENRMLTAEQLAAEEVWLRASQQLSGALDLSEGLELLVDSLTVANPTFYLPPGRRRHPFPVDVGAFLGNRTAYDGVANMYWGKINMAQLRASMLQSARTLRARVQAALAAE
ncbi:MAG TPA: hypothetical protein VFJ16_02190 [Longimicrobium sp.]|nr:hypothetical protein [Longimicrobium sp.]